jgi:mono/diheme cytochrome c family protein
MVEIPEHLLERSRAARARLTGQAPPQEAAPAEPAAPPEESEAPAEAEAEAPAAAAPEPAAPEPAAPEPVAPEVEPAPAPAGAPVAPSAGAVPGALVPSALGAPAAGAIALPPAAPPSPGAPLEIGVRGLAARLGNANEPIRPEPMRKEEGDLVVESAGISAYSAIRSPRWLVALYALIPLFALGYMIQYNVGPKCGQAGTVQVSPKDGGLVDCDGHKLGGPRRPNVRDGGRVYRENCAQCHGDRGQGGVGRKLDTEADGTLLQDFPLLVDQVTFVKGGTRKFRVYGAQQRKAGPIEMPAWQGKLSEFDLESAVVYERETLHKVSEDDPAEALPLAPGATATAGPGAPGAAGPGATATAGPSGGLGR